MKADGDCRSSRQAHVFTTEQLPDILGRPGGHADAVFWKMAWGKRACRDFMHLEYGFAGIVDRRKRPISRRGPVHRAKAALLGLDSTRQF